MLQEDHLPLAISFLHHNQMLLGEKDQEEEEVSEEGKILV